MANSEQRFHPAFATYLRSNRELGVAHRRTVPGRADLDDRLVAVRGLIASGKYYLGE